MFYKELDNSFNVSKWYIVLIVYIVIQNENVLPKLDPVLELAPKCL